MGVIRSLSYCAIYLIYSSPSSIIQYSRYVAKSFFVDTTKGEAGRINSILDTILDKHTAGGKMPVLLTCRDGGVNFLSKNKEALNKKFIVGIEDWQIVSRLTDKLQTYGFALEHGIESPITCHGNEIDRYLQSMRFPAILKPRFMHFPNEISVGKAIKVFDKDSLMKKYDKLASYTPKDNILVQEYIEGPPSNIVSFCSYAKKGRVLAFYVALNKIREFPVEFGIGTFARTIKNPEIETLGKKLIEALGYTGVSEIDFKKDLEDDKYKLLEVNARFYAQNILGKACGIDLADLYYKDLRGADNIHFPASYKENVYWLDIKRDIPYLLKDILSMNISLKGLFNYLVHKKISAVFSSKDPLPFLCEIFLIPLKIVRNFRRLFF